MKNEPTQKVNKTAKQKPAFDAKITVRKKTDIAKSMKSSDSSGQSANSKD